MKKSVALILAVLLLLLFSLTGCSNESTNDNLYADMPETPAEMFEYEENEDGGITIAKYIGEAAEVKIPALINQKKVTTIGYAAFGYNTNLVTVVLPDTVTTINTAAFETCTSLTNVKLSNNLKTISNCAFEECSQLINIALPDSLKDIGMAAFQKCSALKHISIPSQIIFIDESVFMEAGLESVDLPSGLTEIKNYAFYGTNLFKVIVPSSVKNIGFSAFSACKQLKLVELKNGLIKIDNMAFAGDVKLSEIVIPETVTAVLDDSFSGCSTLEAVKFEGDAPQKFQYTMEGYTSDGEPAFLTAQDVHFTVYYHEGATGFTSPEWEGYPTEIW